MSVGPWLSIIIPAYNADKYIRDCIASINLDKNTDIQVLLIDDGSTDSTPVLCDQYASEFKNVSVVHKENGGLPSARNAGLKRVEGDWIWFVDSDDAIAPNALDLLSDICMTSSADAVHIQSCHFSDAKHLRWTDPVVPVSSYSLSSAEFISAVYRGEFGHYMWSYLIRAEALLPPGSSCCAQHDLKTPIFREDFSLYEDVVGMEEFLRQSSHIDVLDFTAYGYRQTESSMTHKKNNNAADSGLRAVVALADYEVSDDLLLDKTRMELSLLFTAYKLVEHCPSSVALEKRFYDEIQKRVGILGITRLGLQRLVRYLLYKSGMMDLIIDWRLSHA